MSPRAATSAFAVLAVILSLQAVPVAAEGAWTSSFASSADLSDVSFPTASNGWVVGAGGVVMRTENGGAGWTRQRSGTSADLTGVDFVDAHHGWAVGADDTILSTANGGARWTRSSTGAGAGLTAVDFVDEGHGWAVGSSPLLLPVIAATSDGGRTWKAQPIPAAGVGLLSVSFADALHGMAVGYAGAAYRTTDGGTTWIPMVVGPGNDPTTVDSFQSVQMLNPTVAVIGSFEGFIYRTDDGGLTWSVRASLGRAVYGLAAAGFRVFAAGGQGMVARSPDGGATWGLEVSGTNEDLRGASAPSLNAAWAAGGGGSVVRFRASRVPTAPLGVGVDPQSCQGGVGIDWIHSAAGIEVDAVAGDLRDDGRMEIVLAGSEGLRAVRPFVPTGRATMWQLPFQAHFQQLRLTELDGDRWPEVVGVTAHTSEKRDGVVAVAAESGRVEWSRTIPGGAQIVRSRDIDGDGLRDVVALGNDQAIHLLSGKTGRDLRPPLALGDYGTDLRIVDVSGRAVAVVATVRNGRVVAFHAGSGLPMWSYQMKGTGASLRAVALDDLNRDGWPDVVVGGNGQASSLSGATAVTNRASSSPGAIVAALDGRTGRRLWDRGESGPSQVNAVSLADLTGDGIPDAVAQISRLTGSHTIALDGRGLVVNGTTTGEPAPLWDRATSGGSGLDLTFTPDDLILADGTGDGAPDVYEALMSGRFLAISGAASRARIAATAPVPPQLWEVTREIPGFHVSWVRIRGRPYVITISGDSLVALRRPDTGAVAWSFDAGGRPALAVGDLTGDRVPDIGVGDRSGRALGLDAGGRALSPRDLFWPAPLAAIAATDVDGDGVAELVAGATDGTVRAFDPVTNRVIWARRLPSGVQVLAAGAGTVAVGRADGVVDGLNRANGRRLWSSPSGSTDPAPVTALSYLPTVRMFAAGDTVGSIRLLGATTGSQRAITIGPSATGGVYAIAGGDLVGDRREEIVAGAGSSFYAFNLDGKRLWAYRTGSFATSVTPVDLTGDGRKDVVGLSWDGKAYGLRGTTGRPIWSVVNGQPAGAAVVRSSAQGQPRILISSVWNNNVAGIRVLTVAGALVGRCQLRKTPYAVAPVAGDAGSVGAVLATVEGDVYRFAV